MTLRSPSQRASGPRELSPGEREAEAARLIDAGNASEDAGRLTDALASYEAAASVCPGSARAHLNRGNALAGIGRHIDALAAFNEALACKTDYASAHVNIGNLHAGLGRADEAIDSYRRALALDPTRPQVHFALAMTLQQGGRLDEAISAWRTSVAADPASVATHTGLGNALLECSRNSEALQSYREAARLAPDSAHVMANLGTALYSLGKHEHAIDAFQRAVELEPNFAAGHVALGKALRGGGRLEEAAASLRRAQELERDNFDACSELAHVLRDLRRSDEAIEAFESALRLRPDDARTHTGYGVLLQHLGRIQDSIAHHEAALAAGDLPEVRNNLGNALEQSGRFDEAIAEYRRAISARPNYWTAHSNLLFAMNYSARELTDCLHAARAFGDALAKSIPAPFASWKTDPRPSRLRVGFVSGDFRTHPVGYFLENVLAHCRETKLELIAYPTFGDTDDLTARIRPAFAEWKPLSGMADEEAARLIRDDGVHVLLDLAGHTAHHRLPMFAWRPAPVQATWLGYFATTGVNGMDYVIGDPHVSPASAAAHFTEAPWRLPDSYLCFTPPAFAIDVGPLPARLAGHVTFGCFNNLAKMNDRVVALWARVLRSVPDAKLLLKTVQLADPEIRKDRARTLRGRRRELCAIDRGASVAESEAARSLQSGRHRPRPLPVSGRNNHGRGLLDGRTDPYPERGPFPIPVG